MAKFNNLDVKFLSILKLVPASATEPSGFSDVLLMTLLNFFKSLFRQNQPVGRKLSFTLQEILREVNTLGSKASNEETTRSVIEIKEEIEKIKEQVLNIL